MASFGDDEGYSGSERGTGNGLGLGGSAFALANEMLGTNMDTARYMQISTATTLDPKSEKDIRDLDRATRGWYWFLAFLGLCGTAIFIGLSAAWAFHQTIYIHLTWTDTGNYGLYQLWARAPSQHFNLGFGLAWPFFVLMVAGIVLGLYTMIHPHEHSEGETGNLLSFGLISWIRKEIGSLRVSEMAILNLHPMRYVVDGLFFGGLALPAFLMLGFTDAIQLAFTALDMWIGFHAMSLAETMIMGRKRRKDKAYNRYGTIAWLFYAVCVGMVLAPFLFLFSMWPFFITQVPTLYWGIFVPFFFCVLWFVGWFLPRAFRDDQSAPTMMGIIGHYMMLIAIATIVGGVILSLFSSTDKWSLATTIPEILATGAVVTSG